MKDSRGVRRGSCTQCGCAAYDGGDAGKKCIDCNHPPGRHKNLDIGTINDSSTRGMPVKNDQSVEPATNAMPVASISMHELEFPIQMSPLTIQENSDEAEESETCSGTVESLRKLSGR